jgi:hypothetical protein
MRTRFSRRDVRSAVGDLCATVTVATTIQPATNLAKSGATILAGTKDRITIEDAPSAIHGTSAPGYVNPFILVGPEIRNYSDNGILLDRVHNFRIAGGTPGWTSSANHLRRR